ncbi:uncharacterized protein At3g52155, chloroplastic isoform X2 [Coffea arabica]|uniref:Uncharacterized protein At3g52155, chloroplastic isoform X2 n=1 Tax=Coffea arabica TaxID=13443 RepID=A0ABM4VL83_COFAR
MNACPATTALPSTFYARVKRKSGGSSFPSTRCTYTKRRYLISLATGSVVVETTPSQQETYSNSVVRRLILLRHADSSWENRSLRGISDSRRTRETLNIMRKEVRGFLEAEVHFLSSFYSVAAMDGQTAEHLRQAISEYSTDEILTVMCMGHNKGWEEAASTFSGVSVELKTCNAALLEAAGKTWEEAFALAGIGGWKLHGIVKPDAGL